MEPGFFILELSARSVHNGPVSPRSTAVKSQGEVIEGTAREVMAKLANLPADKRVRAMIGRPSLSLIARRLQETAAARGMTDEIHDDLMRSLKNDC